jgi:hypothetical protein
MGPFGVSDFSHPIKETSNPIQSIVTLKNQPCSTTRDWFGLSMLNSAIFLGLINKKGFLFNYLSLLFDKLL